jgi:hypothetical protein
VSQFRLRLFYKNGLPWIMTQSTDRHGDPVKPKVTGAQIVGQTGRRCWHCGKVTYGWSDLCGCCGLATGIAL